MFCSSYFEVDPPATAGGTDAAEYFSTSCFVRLIVNEIQTKPQAQIRNPNFQIPVSLPLIVLPYILYQFRNLFRLEFVFERWHLFLSVSDHLGDLFVRVLFGVVGF